MGLDNMNGSLESMSMEVLTAKVWGFRKHEYVGPDSKSRYGVQRT
jgi:hypothetical protein